MAIAPYTSPTTDPAFVDGELAAHFSPNAQSAPPGRWFMSRRMYFQGGLYTIKALCDNAAYWWVGKRPNESQMVLYHALHEGVVTRTIYIAPGDQRIEVEVLNTMGVVSPNYIVFSLWRGDELITFSGDDGWFCDQVQVGDDFLQAMNDFRRDLPVFSFLPNWQNGISERLSFFSDVMQSESGAEQRRAVRVSPRRSFEASFLRKGGVRSAIDSFLVDVGRREFMLPLWHEAVRMVQGITGDSAGVDFQFSDPMMFREFRAGDLVFVNNGDPHDYEILEVGDVLSTSFTWKSQPTRTWPKGTRVYPMRKVRIVDQAQATNVTDQVAQLQIRFELVEADERIAAWGYETRGKGFFTFQPNRIEPIRLSYNRITYTLDNESSIVSILDPGGDSQVDLTATFLFRGRGDVSRFRSFIAAAKGQHVGFLMNSYTDDIEIVEDIPSGESYIQISDSSYSDFLKLDQRIRIMIGALTQEGVWIVREIVASEPGVLHLDEPFYVQRHELKRVSFVSPARFAQDSFELQHVTAESAVVTTRLVFRQIYDRRIP